MEFYFQDCENSGSFLLCWQPKCWQLGLHPSLSKIPGNLTHTPPASSISPKGPMGNYSGRFTNEVALLIPHIEAHSLKSPHVCDSFQ